MTSTSVVMEWGFGSFSFLAFLSFCVFVIAYAPFRTVITLEAYLWYIGT